MYIYIYIYIHIQIYIQMDRQIDRQRKSQTYAAQRRARRMLGGEPLNVCIDSCIQLQIYGQIQIWIDRQIDTRVHGGVCPLPHAAKRRAGRMLGGEPLYMYIQLSLYIYMDRYRYGQKDRQIDTRVHGGVCPLPHAAKRRSRRMLGGAVIDIDIYIYRYVQICIDIDGQIDIDRQIHICIYIHTQTYIYIIYMEESVHYRMQQNGAPGGCWEVSLFL